MSCGSDQLHLETMQVATDDQETDVGGWNPAYNTNGWDLSEKVLSSTCFK